MNAGLSPRMTRWLGQVTCLESAALQRVCLRLAVRYSTADGFLTFQPGTLARELALTPRVLRTYLAALTDGHELIEPVRQASRSKPAVYAVRIRSRERNAASE